MVKIEITLNRGMTEDYNKTMQDLITILTKGYPISVLSSEEEYRCITVVPDRVANIFAALNDSDCFCAKELCAWSQGR